MLTKEKFIELSQKYSTPLYVYDFDIIKDNVNAFKKAFCARKSIICYALKANSNLSVLKYLSLLDCGCDCVSINEVKRAILAGIPKYKIIYSGVGKSESDIKEALNLDILFINLESIEEMLKVEQIAKDMNKEARISIRVNPNIDAKTHPYISTGLKENKFGVDLDSAKKMYIYANNSKYLLPIGIHFHIGSQLLELEPLILSAKKVVELIWGLLALKVDLKFIDIGGGLGISYGNEEIIDLYSYAQGILSTLSGLDLTIICEPGRRIVGNAGSLVSSVLYEKQNENKRFCIIDAAMNDLIRPSLYSANHRVEFIKLALTNIEIPPLLLDSTPLHSRADIVGPICESGDYIAKNVEIPRMNSGDLVIIRDVGAYGFSMSSNYNSRFKCAEVAIIDSKDRLIRKRDDFNDLISNEIEFL
ncbi:diaminopimelate decarboxylase [Helicobacter sp. MIT 14-3879]|uniref:diaminopimelate decarboxylase n=1 Tax=Helicobacter sp. MIT 14-3879 TaxID=2040649 RepID=UPI000E1F2DF6|nr:diaminopimelate decarboxylase [Helicobacter sp. MIT 14-3879]RDU65161.1 diaminopimelate decarboxylase [Helicobacter sp. MIT 14-3879]